MEKILRRDGYIYLEPKQDVLKREYQYPNPPKGPSDNKYQNTCSFPPPTGFHGQAAVLKQKSQGEEFRLGLYNVSILDHRSCTDTFRPEIPAISRCDGSHKSAKIDTQGQEQKNDRQGSDSRAEVWKSCAERDQRNESDSNPTELYQLPRVESFEITSLFLNVSKVRLHDLSKHQVPSIQGWSHLTAGRKKNNGAKLSGTADKTATQQAVSIVPLLQDPGPPIHQEQVRHCDNLIDDILVFSKSKERNTRSNLRTVTITESYDRQKELLWDPAEGSKAITKWQRPAVLAEKLVGMKSEKRALKILSKIGFSPILTSSIWNQAWEMLIEPMLLNDNYSPMRSVESDYDSWHQVEEEIIRDLER
ncbi:hypothetical protein Tco_0497244 [Tanacetum coccineum]